MGASGSGARECGDDRDIPPPISGVTKSAHSVFLAVTSSASFVLALRPELTHSAAPALPPAQGAAGAPMRKLRPQARVVGQPPHERRHLGRKQTGRTRKGYAASVSGKAANGCAVRGQKKKCRRRTCTCVQVCLKRGSSESVPPFFAAPLPAHAGPGHSLRTAPARAGLVATSGWLPKGLFF